MQHICPFVARQHNRVSYSACFDFDTIYFVIAWEMLPQIIGDKLSFELNLMREVTYFSFAFTKSALLNLLNILLVI